MPTTSPVRISAALEGLGVPSEETWNIARGLEGAGPGAILSVAKLFQDEARRNEELALQKEYAPWRQIYNPALNRELRRDQIASNEALRQAQLDTQRQIAMDKLFNQRLLLGTKERGKVGRQQEKLGYKREALGQKREAVRQKTALGHRALDEKHFKTATDAELRRELYDTQRRIAQYRGEVAMRGQDTRRDIAQYRGDVRMRGQDINRERYQMEDARAQELNQLRDRWVRLQDETRRRRDLLNFNARNLATMTRAEIARLASDTQKEITRVEQEVKLTMGREKIQLIEHQSELKKNLALLNDATRRRGQDIGQYTAEIQERGRSHRAAQHEKAVTQRARVGERGKNLRAAVGGRRRPSTDERLDVSNAIKQSNPDLSPQQVQQATDRYFQLRDEKEVKTRETFLNRPEPTVTPYNVGGPPNIEPRPTPPSSEYSPSPFFTGDEMTTEPESWWRWAVNNRLIY